MDSVITGAAYSLKFAVGNGNRAVAGTGVWTFDAEATMASTLVKIVNESGNRCAWTLWPGPSAEASLTYRRSDQSILLSVTWPMDSYLRAEHLLELVIRGDCRYRFTFPTPILRGSEPGRTPTYGEFLAGNTCDLNPELVRLAVGAEAE